MTDEQEILEQFDRLKDRLKETGPEAEELLRKIVAYVGTRLELIANSADHASAKGLAGNAKSVLSKIEDRLSATRRDQGSN